MRPSDQRRPLSVPPAQAQPIFHVGDQVSIVRAPVSYGYNGCTGVIVAVDGHHIKVRVENPPDDMYCTMFYAEELAHARGGAAEGSGLQP